MQAMELSGEGASSALRVSVLGDSISTFEDLTFPGNRVYYQPPQTQLTGVTDAEQTWWMQVIRHLGASLLSNASYSGSMVQGKGFPAAEQPGRAQQLLGPQGQQPNVVLVFMGVNDYGWGSPEAQEAGRSEAAPAVVAARASGWKEEDGPLPGEDILPEAAPGAAPTDAAQRFGASYQRMLRHVRAAAPEAEVWCLTVPPGRERGKTAPAFAYGLRGVPLEAYNQAIRDAAGAEGAHVADVAALGFDYDAHDGTHPTAEGMEQLASMVLHSIYRESQKAPSRAGSALSRRPLPPLPADAMRADCWCEQPTCIGCSHARSTGNPWFCICDG